MYRSFIGNNKMKPLLAIIILALTGCTINKTYVTDCPRPIPDLHGSVQMPTDAPTPEPPKSGTIKKPAEYPYTYYDGCNTCTVTDHGATYCTLLYCPKTWTLVDTPPSNQPLITPHNLLN